MVRRCEFCDSPVPADATVCPVCREEIAEETLEKILPLLKRPEAPDVHVMGTPEKLWGVIRRPNVAYRDIAQRPDAFGPFVIIILNALVMVGFFLALASKMNITMTINGTATEVSMISSQYGGYLYLGAMMTIIPNIMLGFFYLIIGTAFAHLALKILGGTGNRKKTLSIIGYSMLPTVLFRAIAIVIALVVTPTFLVDNPTMITNAIYGINASPIWEILDYLTYASFVWVGFLLIFGIRETHNTSTVWAFVISIICMIVLGWTFWRVH